jgi:ABC-type uncharacterized transport system auxiliary subunit
VESDSQIRAAGAGASVTAKSKRNSPIKLVAAVRTEVNDDGTSDEYANYLFESRELKDNQPVNKFMILAKPVASCFLLCSSCLLLFSCSGVPETFYYTVSNWNAPPVKSENHNAATPDMVLGVEKFTAETIYEDDRIIYRDSPFEVKYYHYRRWAAPPRALVTDEVLKQLRASSCCREVVASPSQTRVNYILAGRVLAFEEWDQGEKWYGRVALLIQIYEPASRRLVWQNIFQAESPVAKKIPAAVVEAIGTSLQKCVSDLQEALPAVLPVTQ